MYLCSLSVNTGVQIVKSSDFLNKPFLTLLLFLYAILAPVILLLLFYDVFSVPENNILTISLCTIGYLLMQFLVSFAQRRMKVGFHWAMYIIVPAWSCGVTVLNSQNPSLFRWELVFPASWLVGVLLATYLGYAFTRCVENRASHEKMQALAEEN